MLFDRRDRVREKLREASEDLAAQNAHYGRVRFTWDVAYRRRYSRYLRQEISHDELLDGETHAQWYERVLGAQTGG